MNDHESKQALQKIRAAQFVRNNGRVITTINILRDKFVSLTDVHYALEDMDERKFLDCINFLSESGYIQLRVIGAKTPANLADEDFHRLEAKLSAQGIRLMAGKLLDEMVDV